MPQERKGIAALTHKYTDIWVEGLRLVLPDKRYPMPKWLVTVFGWPDSSMTKGKDLAYIIGHIIVYGHIPVILALLIIGGMMLI